MPSNAIKMEMMQTRIRGLTRTNAQEIRVFKLSTVEKANGNTV